MMPIRFNKPARGALLGLAALFAEPSLAVAQDIPGIENCSAEKDMARRTGCLQSNVNYLKAQLTQMQTVTFGRIEAANRQIDALKATIVSLQTTVTELKETMAKQSGGAQKSDAPKSEPAKK